MKTFTGIIHQIHKGTFVSVSLILFLFSAVKSQDCHPGFHFTVTGSDVEFNNTSTATGDITSYYWDFGDGSTSDQQTPSHTYASDGNYYVCLTITAHNPNCTEMFCDSIVIHDTDTCHASFTFHATGLSVDFTDASTSTETINSWLWDFGDGHTSDQQNPSHTYDHEGTYHVCLTITDIHEICTSTYCHDVTVHHPSDSCHASFTFHIDSTGNGIQFTNTSTGTTAHTVYDWTFGDGTSSADEDPFHHYIHSGHHTVCLYITDTTTGCTSHTCHTIYHHSEFHIADHNEDLTIALPAGMANEGINLFAYPNPFSDAFTVNYELANPAEVKIEFFDLAGRIIMSLQNHFEEAGAHTKFFSEDNLSFGVYFLKLSVDQNFYVIKIAVQK